jgi:hypothetical protein
MFGPFGRHKVDFTTKYMGKKRELDASLSQLML